MLRNQVSLVLLLIGICLGFGARTSKRMGYSDELNMSLATKALTSSSSMACCCKAVEPGTEDEECNADKETKLKGLYHFNTEQGTCCKLVTSMFGCAFYGNYKSAEKESCALEDRQLPEPLCCRVSSSVAFFVHRVLRGSRLTYRDSPEGSWGDYEVPISTAYIVGATYQGDDVGPNEAVDHLKDIVRRPSAHLSCRRGLQKSEKCEISTENPNKCCCEEDNLWAGDRCIPVPDSLPDSVIHEGATWLKAKRQNEVICKEYGKKTREVREPYQHRYTGQCERQELKRGHHPSPFVAAAASRWVTVKYSCQKYETRYRTVSRMEDVCVREANESICKTAGEAMYQRQVPFGQCRQPDTLVSLGNFGRSTCPKNEVPEGYNRRGIQCKCESSC